EPISADQASAGRTSPPPKRGPIAKTADESAVTKKPLARKRSTRRPSTEYRAAASTATRSPAPDIAVWRTRRSSGRSQWVRSAGEARNSARLAPSRPASRISPQSHLWDSFRSSRFTSLLSAARFLPIGVGSALHHPHRRRPPAHPRGPLVAAARTRL